MEIRMANRLCSLHGVGLSYIAISLPMSSICALGRVVQRYVIGDSDRWPWSLFGAGLYVIARGGLISLILERWLIGWL